MNTDLESKIGHLVWDSVWDSVLDLVDDLVDDSVDDSVWNSVSHSVRDSVWNIKDSNLNLLQETLNAYQFNN